MNIKCSFIIVLFQMLILSEVCVCKDAWKSSEIPDPTTDFDECGNNGTKRWICDPENYLNQTEKSDLQEKINLIFNNF